MRTLSDVPDPTDAELRDLELQMPDFTDLDAELTRALDAKRSAIPLKAKRRDRPTFGIQKLDTLYKDPANWEPWCNVTLVYRPTGITDSPNVETILGFFISYKHREVKGARKLVRSPADPLLGHEIEYVSDKWYLDWHHPVRQSALSTELHFPVSLQIVLDDGLRSEGEHVVHVGATRGVGIRRAVLDSPVRLHDGNVVLYLPAGLDILDGLDHASKLRLKEAFDGQGN